MDSEVRRILNKKAGDHMRNVMNKAKTTQRQPAWMDDQSWREIHRKWASEEHKRASERNKINRTSSSRESGIGTYAGGSITVAEHKRKMVSILSDCQFIPLIDCMTNWKSVVYVRRRCWERRPASHKHMSGPS